MNGDKDPNDVFQIDGPRGVPYVLSWNHIIDPEEEIIRGDGSRDAAEDASAWDDPDPDDKPPIDPSGRD